MNELERHYRLTQKVLRQFYEKPAFARWRGHLHECQRLGARLKAEQQALAEQKQTGEAA